MIGDSTKIRLQDQLFQEFELQGAELERMNATDLDIVKQICNKQDVIIWLNNYSKLQPVYVNDIGKQYYGFDSNLLSEIGFEVYTKILHPDDLGVINNHVSFFNKHPESSFRTALRMMHKSGEYRWFYGLDRALNFTENGVPEFMISIAYEIENIVQETRVHSFNSKNDDAKRSRYNTITPREIEILGLIAQELTSREIAERLLIEASTVDTHRKHLIEKLQVKSSVGLVSYFLRFSDGN